MAISRAQLLKELVPGLHAIFGTEYNRYENEALYLLYAKEHQPTTNKPTTADVCTAEDDGDFCKYEKKNPIQP